MRFLFFLVELEDACFWLHEHSLKDETRPWKAHVPPCNMCCSKGLQDGTHAYSSVLLQLHVLPQNKV